MSWKKSLSRGSLLPGQPLVFIRTSWTESCLVYIDKNPVLLLQTAEGFQTHPDCPCAPRDSGDMEKQQLGAQDPQFG